ncbi:aldo/keto reductase [Flavisolibacter tropicus]|uniref:Oxidoreductase n=1 Tax=Flavisolibacter tropicus TaxID=1492898 RepID=A0A172TQ63_9BACT|nr:aldo/keto reductase [Flavisolibacter tropicus]ANE49160.1 oxidoreductase [Flavisolibacter tropicus]
MQYTTIGSSALKVSRIGYGCMSLKQEADAHALLQKAVAMGINYFDTADLYDKGANEEWVGAALKPKRQQVIIASKVGNIWRPDGSGWDWNPSKQHILKTVEESLKRLQTDYIDLYQLHGGTLQDPIDEAIEAFEQLVQQGKIRYYGISSIRPNVIREWVKRSNIVSVMTQYSLLDRRPEEANLPLLQEKGIGVLVRGGVAQGLLVNKPAAPYLNYTEEQVKKAADAVNALSGKERNAAQTAIQFVLEHPAVVAAVVGMRTDEQLEDAVQALNAPMLSGEERQQLLDILPPLTYQEHR